MRNTKLLLINTAVLTAGGFLMRTIAVSFNVYLTNRIGASGMGLFQLIMAVYGLLITFASAGIKLGATRLVTDSLCKKEADTKKTMGVCIRYALAAGCAVAGTAYLFSNLICTKWIADVRADYSLKILALSLPPIAVSAALNGYFTARKTMVKYAGVQLAEQICKIAVTVFMLNVFSGQGLRYMCGAVAIGTTCSELVSCMLSFGLYLRDKKPANAKTKQKRILGSLLHIAVPDVMGSGMRSILLTVEHLLIPGGFKKSGQSTEEALSTYGTVHGMALPVILYPAAVLTSLSSLIVPELARYLTLKKQDKINKAAGECIRITTIFGFGTAAFMFTFSDCISQAVYNSTESAFYIKLLSVLLPVMYLDTVVDGMLKGLDQQVASMRYNIFDSGLCVILVYFLLPKYAVKGYIFILFISEIINFSLSINRLMKVATLSVNPIRDFLKPAIASLGACATVNIVILKILYGISPKIQLILAIIMFVTIYIPANFMLGSVERHEIKEFSSRIKG
ncbi:MAG: polysaccharide biosynthesis C-terminal domain-containing protein [Clostridia bacterium]|nr:polysaccharide biosynthesis C-terminal domain-containing protein [Clostridia bacterium]